MTRRGHALVAGAGRIIGAIAAAGPEPAAAAMSLGLAPLLDAAGLGPAGETARARPGAGPLGLVLATPAACGALDGALGGANAPSGLYVKLEGSAGQSLGFVLAPGVSITRCSIHSALLFSCFAMQTCPRRF